MPHKPRVKPARFKLNRSHLRKISQYGFLLAFVGIFIYASRGMDDFRTLINLPFLVDPLVSIAVFFSRQPVVTGIAVSSITIFLTIIFGRVWCGWVCPFGTVLDLFPFSSRKKPLTEKFEGWRKVKYLTLILIVIFSFFGLFFGFLLDPITLSFRTFTTSIWPFLNLTFSSIERWLYAINFLRAPIDQAEQILRPVFFPLNLQTYRFAFIFGITFAIFICLNLIAERFFCRNLCPLGGLLSLLSKFSIIQRHINQNCSSCGLCSTSCPMGTIDPDDEYRSDPGECIMCFDCEESCARSGASFNHIEKSPVSWKDYNPSRRSFLLTLGAGAGTALLLDSDPATRWEDPHHILPPGGRESNLIDKCIRCGECVRVCPTTALQFSLLEAGIHGFMSPCLIPRIGYCDYACNACGQVCPVSAIPNFSLIEKRQAVIGKAYIQQNRCIAWSDQKNCIVCEEMCPIPEKAIILSNHPDPVLSSDSPQPIQVPYVLRDRCIGCGICEYQCPVNGEAAIRVYIPGVNTPQ